MTLTFFDNIFVTLKKLTTFYRLKHSHIRRIKSYSYSYRPNTYNGHISTKNVILNKGYSTFSESTPIFDDSKHIGIHT